MIVRLTLHNTKIIRHNLQFKDIKEKIRKRNFRLLLQNIHSKLQIWNDIHEYLLEKSK